MKLFNNVKVLSKVDFDDLMREMNFNLDNVESEDCIFISIHSSDKVGNNSEPYFSENRKNVLNMVFDDIESKDSNSDNILFDDDMVDIILSFLENNDTVSKCVVHCLAGISRSGAVGTFLINYFGWDYSIFKKLNPDIKPNGLVMRKLNRTLWF